MKTANKKEKSITEKLREIRNEISADIQDMNHEELQKCLKAKKSLFPDSVWQKNVPQKAARK